MTETNAPTTQGLLAWEAPEFVVRDKTWSWSVAVWLGALAIAGLFLWGNGLNFTGILAASVVLLAALSLTLQSRAKPKLTRIVIGTEGLSVGGRLHPWDELKGFWIVYEPTNQALYLETARRFLSIISVQLGKADPEAVRAALLEHIPEHAERAEELGDRLGRLIRF